MIWHQHKTVSRLRRVWRKEAALPSLSARIARNRGASTPRRPTLIPQGRSAIPAGRSVSITENSTYRPGRTGIITSASVVGRLGPGPRRWLSGYWDCPASIAANGGGRPIAAPLRRQDAELIPELSPFPLDGGKLGCVDISPSFRRRQESRTGSCNYGRETGHLTAYGFRPRIGVRGDVLSPE